MIPRRRRQNTTTERESYGLGQRYVLSPVDRRLSAPGRLFAGYNLVASSLDAARSWSFGRRGQNPALFFRFRCASSASRDQPKS
jgi:hypothetical protein